MLDMSLKAEAILPTDSEQATLVGRVWRHGDIPGPSVVVIRGGEVRDMSRLAPTVSELLNMDDPVSAFRAHEGERIGTIEEILANSHADALHPSLPNFLAPVDLQALKAAGVTFVRSTLERVIEEHTKGDPTGAEAAREKIEREIGGDLAKVKPGSEEA